MTTLGCAADYRDLAARLERWEEAVRDFGAWPFPKEAAFAEAAWLLMVARAEVCGLPPGTADVPGWVRWRLELFKEIAS